jgi:arginase
LTPRSVILVGARDLDAPERRLVDDGSVALVPVADDMAERLGTAIAGRPVYVHLDCDVLAPGTVPTDYAVPDGMTLDQLRDCADVIAHHAIVGIEIAELETEDAADGTPDDPARRLVAALEPILRALGGTA